MALISTTKAYHFGLFAKLRPFPEGLAVIIKMRPTEKRRK
jgi:hypothetical protein